MRCLICDVFFGQSEALHQSFAHRNPKIKWRNVRKTTLVPTERVLTKCTLWVVAD